MFTFSEPKIFLKGPHFESLEGRYLEQLDKTERTFGKIFSNILDTAETF
jgi:hypothetical protein